MKLRLYILAIAIILSSLSKAQKYEDQIITTSHDTIACIITQVNEDTVFYKFLLNNVEINSRINRDNILSYIWGSKFNETEKKRFVLFCHDTTEKLINQNFYNKNCIFGEALGNGLYYSLNYERIIYYRYRNALSVRVGHGIFPVFTYPMVYISNIPILFNYITPANKPINFEIGIGSRLMFYVVDKGTDNASVRSSADIVANLGARFLVKKHFLFKIDLTPQIKTNFYEFSQTGRFLWFGISIGYSF